MRGHGNLVPLITDSQHCATPVFIREEGRTPDIHCIPTPSTFWIVDRDCADTL